MYNNLGVQIVINKYKSEVLQVERGFMEGHPPRMAAFVVAMIPLLNELEKVVTGITTPDDEVHKVKAFADDLKLFLTKVEEIPKCYDVICRFEKVSGLKIHRDPARGKCQALSFGNHRNCTTWPGWVTVSNKIKIVGIIFSNEVNNFEKFNTDLVSQNFFNELHKVQAMRGTILQKVYIVNTFLFSKLWYVGHSVKLEKKTIENILKRALNFIYAGENERPVRQVNFRDKAEGGLGLIHPGLKAKALLIKNMFKDFIKYEVDINDDVVNNLYGYPEEFREVVAMGLIYEPVKVIYKMLIDSFLTKNRSLIPSRNEKKTDNIKWSVTWKNLKLLTGITAEERMFIWKVTQDMLPVGKRIHRKNAERRCLGKLADGEECQEVQDLYHALSDCKNVEGVFKDMKTIVEDMLEKKLENEKIIFLDFNTRQKSKLKLVLWFVVKCLYYMYLKKIFNKEQLFREIRKELDWNLDLMRVIGSPTYMRLLKLKL